jgi:hypothetical protein
LIRIHTSGGAPGRESDPVSPRSQWSAVVQTQGAINERSPEIWMRLIFCEQSVEYSRQKGPSGPFCTPRHFQSQLRPNAGTVGTGVSAIGISPPGNWLLSAPYKCLRDIHGVPSRCDRRSAVKFVAKVERFTDSETKCVIVGTGQNPIARIATRGHDRRLQAGRYRMAEI